MRIKKYKIFRNTSLLESILVVNPEFKNILTLMPPDNNIADILYRMIGDKDDIKTTYNFIGQGEKNDEISFIPDNQYQRFVDKGEDVSNKSKNFAKIGRMVRQILKENGHEYISDSDIEKFVNQFKSTWDDIHGIGIKSDLVKGDDIIYWYNEERYFRKAGTLGNSCMRFEYKGEYMKLYAGNPDKCSLLILTKDELLLARALVWKLDDGRIFLDRIYSVSDNYAEFAYNWAVKNLGKNAKLVSHFKSDAGSVKCTLNNTQFEYYPYADTMYYLSQELSDGIVVDSGKSFVTNREDLAPDEYIKRLIQNTDGSSNVENYNWSDYQSKWLDKTNNVWDPYESSYIEKSIATYCDTLGEWIIKANCVWSERLNDFIPRRQAIEHDKFGTILPQSIIKVVTGYNGDKSDPIDIWFEMSQDKSKINLEVDLRVGGDIKLEMPHSAPFHNKCDINIIIRDVYNRPQVGFLCYELVNISFDSIPKGLEFMSTSHGGRAWMTKIDAEIFNIKVISDKRSYIDAISYTNMFIGSIHRKLISEINRSDASSDVKLIRVEMANRINEILIDRSTKYEFANLLYDQLGDDADPVEIYLEIFKKALSVTTWSFGLYKTQKVSEYIERATKYEASEHVYNENKIAIDFMNKYFTTFLFFYGLGIDTYDSIDLLETHLNFVNNDDLGILRSRVSSFGSLESLFRSIMKDGARDSIQDTIKDTTVEYLDSKNITSDNFLGMIKSNTYDRIYNKMSEYNKVISRLYKSDIEN